MRCLSQGKHPSCLPNCLDPQEEIKAINCMICLTPWFVQCVTLFLCECAYKGSRRQFSRIDYNIELKVLFVPRSKWSHDFIWYHLIYECDNFLGKTSYTIVLALEKRVGENNWKLVHCHCLVYITLMYDQFSCA